jgi:antitoxin component of RelBE/YafQ-DinJ toxin-antitoxin module
MEKVQANRNHYITLFFAFSFGMILSNLIGQNSQNKAGDEKYVLAYRGIDKTMDELPSVMAEKLTKLEAEYVAKKTGILEDAGIQFFIHDYAQTHALPLEKAVEQLFPADEPEEHLVAAFYQENENVIQQPYFEVKRSIAKHLRLQKMDALRAQTLQTLIDKGDLIYYLP